MSFVKKTNSLGGRDAGGKDESTAAKSRYSLTTK
jgi:hypothetical protein